MSSIHNDAKALIYWLAEGDWPDLDEIERRKLARWGTMIFMNLEDMGRIKRLPQEHRNQLRVGGVPQGWVLSIMSLGTDEFAGQSWTQNIAIEALNGDGTLWPALHGWFCVERVLFHAIAIADSKAQVVGLVANPHIQALHSLREIWPGSADRSIGGPTRRTVQDLIALVENYSGRFGKGKRA